jgi:hypothetical protein
VRGNPSRFLREQIRAAAEAGARGDGKAVRRHLDHAVAEDPDALRHIAKELRRR